MKLAKSQLKRIIKEELVEALSFKDAEAMSEITPWYNRGEEILRDQLALSRLSFEEHDEELQALKDEVIEHWMDPSTRWGKYNNISDWLRAQMPSYGTSTQSRQRGTGEFTSSMWPTWAPALHYVLESRHIKLEPDVQAWLDAMAERERSRSAGERSRHATRISRRSRKAPTTSPLGGITAPIAPLADETAISEGMLEQIIKEELVQVLRESQWAT